MSLSTSLLLRGLFAIVIGFISVAWPNITIGAIVILFAIYCFGAAITEGMRAFSSERAGPVVGYLLLAVLSIAGGVVALVWPSITALVLVLWVASWAIVTGAVEVALTFRHGANAGERAIWILSGLLSIGLGAVLFVRPDIGAVSLATVFGLFTIVYGVSAVVLSFQARSLAHAGPRLASR
jgi:uncharacterized membrane protein HdeD (DUF308 family)